MKLFRVLLTLVMNVLMFIVSMVTLMVMLPVSMVVVTVHHSIKNLSLNKGFMASDAYLAQKICAWADGIRRVQIIMAKREQQRQNLQELQDAIDLGSKFGKLLDDIDDNDPAGNVERVAKFLDDMEDIDEKWEQRR